LIKKEVQNIFWNSKIQGKIKAKLFFMILMVSCGCLSALYGADEPENILLDGGFEEIKKVEDVIAGTNGPWQVRGADKGLAKPSINKKDKVEGKQSLYVEILNPGWSDIQQGWWTGSKHFVLEPDVTYTLSAWMKTSEPADVSIKLMSWTDPFPNWGTKRVTVKTSWVEYHLTCTPKELTERPWCEFRFETVKALWFDFAHLYKGEYVPSAGPHSVTSQDKLAFTWGGIKKLRWRVAR